MHPPHQATVAPTAKRRDEITALRTGIDLGMTMIDAAEKYGGDASEELVGEAIAGRRDEVFLVDKVLPSNASRRGIVQACRRSLQRLGVDHLDLYLLHWRGSHPLAETIEAFAELIDAGDTDGDRPAASMPTCGKSWDRCFRDRRPLPC